jgi:hypothetical protein
VPPTARSSSDEADGGPTGATARKGNDGRV